jgi:hypothetical protein
MTAAIFRTGARSALTPRKKAADLPAGAKG